MAVIAPCWFKDVVPEVPVRLITFDDVGVGLICFLVEDSQSIVSVSWRLPVIGAIMARSR